MPQDREAEYIAYLERMLGKDFLSEIGFFQLDDKKQSDVIRQMVDLLGTRLGQAVSGALAGSEDLHALEEKLQRGDSVFEIYDYIMEKIPSFQEQVVKVIEEFKQELRDHLAAV